MRTRPFLAAAAALIAAVSAPASRARAQDTGTRLADGLVPGDYLRVGASVVTPIRPGGSLRDWHRGRGISVAWETWNVGSGGVSRFGFGLEGAYSRYPLDEQQFLMDFTNSPNGRPITATADDAGILQVQLVTRFRIPTPYVMPTIGVGFGFFDWRPGEIAYTADAGRGTVTQQHRSGGSITFMGGLDKHVAGRFAVFADASYTYAYTSFGGGLAATGTVCLAADCDLLKNTQLSVFRGGVRARVGR